ncbi:unnamed protein product [Candidula unifasciata]|uniref:GPR180/TMEM145 transmembrane domain-containing protein n=1 Tax=Candidula unifasciata TaxID=100452 RepID=A0A8S3ZXL7_9EUPU|nr:unnamed protein product [Candidula unifasciata]
MIINVWLSLWCFGFVSHISNGLHLTGTWNSKDFFIFLTKFGFQKTDPKQQENTQGYIYGNITKSNNVNTTKDLTLVVVDSEYFLEYYGNSTIRSKQTCPAMFVKVDQIAFDYICKPKGLEDFLRKIPCPKDKLCIDEDNPKNVVPGYQFTYKVRDVQRPRFWYLSFVSCFRDTSGRKCEWQSSEDSGIIINYDIWLVNGNPSVRGQNPFEHQFSFEFHDVFEIHVIALILCIAIFLLWLYAFSKQRHMVTRLFTACLCGEMLSITLNLIHVSIFAYNGVGAEWLGKVGTLLDLATQCVFMLLLLLLAKGLGITTDQFKWKSVIFSLWAAYTLLNIFLYVWNLVEIDNIISNTDEWQSWPGYATLAFRIVVMFWFLYELRKTFGHTDREDMTFVMHFGAFFLVWFCYLPALALITTQVSPLWRYKTIISINYAVDILAYAVLVHLFWPARSILFLVEGERPLQTYDLEITGLLDDMQEMAIFNRAEALAEISSQKNQNKDDISNQPSTSTDVSKVKGRKSRNGTTNGRVLSNGHLQFQDNSAYEMEKESPKDT